MNKITIHTQIELMEVIQQIGFLPLVRQWYPRIFGRGDG